MITNSKLCVLLIRTKPSIFQEIQKIELSESVDRDREEDAKMFKEIMDEIRYLNKGCKGIRQWPIKCYPIMIHKIEELA